MHSFAKRIATIVVAGALALGGLSTCGANEPKSAEEVMTRSAANTDANNFHSDITMKYQMSLFGQSLDFDMKLGMDVANDNAHVTTEISGLNQLTNSEMYLEKTGDTYTQYSCNNPNASNPTWSKSSLTNPNLINSLTSSDMLKQGEFSKVDNGYQIKVTGKDFLNALGSSGLNTTQSLESALGNDESVKKAIENSKATYTFDNDCRLTGLTYALSLGSNASAGASSGSDSTTVDLSASLSLNLDMQTGNYGKVDASSVIVPENVKSNAVDTSSAVKDLASTLTGNNNSNASNTDSPSSSSSTQTQADAA